MPNSLQSHDIIYTARSIEKVINRREEAESSVANKFAELYYLDRKNYVEKFITLTKDYITRSESERFLEVVQNLRDLKSKQLDQLNIEVLENNEIGFLIDKETVVKSLYEKIP